MNVFNDIKTADLLLGKTVLITGATGGLGRALSRRFLDAGAAPILVGRSEMKLKQLADELSVVKDSQIRFVTADFRNPDSIAEVISLIVKQWGAPDVLVNNAGIQGPIGPSWENDPQLWEETIAINLLAPVNFCRHIIPSMRSKEYGRIINISGGGAAGPRPNFSAYASSKAALVRYSETVASELATTGITVNCIAPGPLATEMTDEVIKAGLLKAGKDEYQRALHTAGIKGDTAGRAVDLAVFLASHHSDGITGRLISAVWDPWESLPEHKDDLAAGDIYTLRRITPADRGQDWGKS